MKDKIRIIFFSVLLFVFVFSVLTIVIYIENEAKKTQLGLTIMYFVGVLVFLHNIYAFYKKKAMSFRSLTFYHPRDKEMRTVIFFASIIAVGGFGFAFLDSLLKIL